MCDTLPSAPVFAQRPYAKYNRVLLPPASAARISHATSPISIDSRVYNHPAGALAEPSRLCAFPIPDALLVSVAISVLEHARPRIRVHDLVALFRLLFNLPILLALGRRSRLSTPSYHQQTLRSRVGCRPIMSPPSAARRPSCPRFPPNRVDAGQSLTRARLNSCVNCTSIRALSVEVDVPNNLILPI